MSGELSIVQYLISKGCDVIVQNKEGDTPLMKAADFGYLEIVRFLVDQYTEDEIRNEVSI